ncbi:hypothetical protein [Rhizobium leguminosarum]|uniref:hypothetical protein n=1 Tax=Rhizobium leguminosarum TaxID=384 RepID=UPI0013EE9FED|nr:hypothetical protein [Rhizobium leguminosarum]
MFIAHSRVRERTLDAPASRVVGWFHQQDAHDRPDHEDQYDEEKPRHDGVCDDPDKHDGNSRDDFIV